MVEIIGRSSSHFTRVTRIFAYELGVPVQLVPVYDMTSVDAAVFANNPALKLPSLRREDGSLVFGSENICRTLVGRANVEKRVVWPEELHADVARNAQEMVSHGMAAQVQLVMGTQVGKLPADNVYFVKSKAGFAGALLWLNQNLHEVLELLPVNRDVSFFEVSLFCLLEHLKFRETLPLAPYSSLTRFAQTFAERPSAQATPYRIDVRP